MTLSTAAVPPVAAAAGKAVRTIEDLSADGPPHPVQQAWLARSVPQRGYCQPGMQMAAVAFLEKHRADALAADPEAEPTPPTDAEIRRAITNICRCGCYERIRQAVVEAGSV